MTVTKNRKRVVIIGAGFSISAGIPPQARLLEEIFKIKGEDLDFHYSQIHDDKIVLKLFLYSLYGQGCELKNIALEDIYTLIDSSISKHRNIGIYEPSALFKIRESLDRLILYIVNKDISQKDVKKYGKKVKELIGTSDTYFISLNWDYLLEQILVHLEYGINYGVPLEHTDNLSHRETQLLVLKPHGSLNWRLCPICETIYAFIGYENIFQCRKCKNLYNLHSKTIENLQRQGLTFKRELLPLLVSPTFLKNNSIPQLNIIMQSIYPVLSEADELVFIGYSLPISDHDIRELLIKSYSANPNKSVVVYLKPSSDAEKLQLESHYSSIFENLNLNFHWNGF